MIVVGKIAAAAIAALGAVFIGLAAGSAAPEPQVGPQGRVPAWVDEERAAATGSRSAAAE